LKPRRIEDDPFTTPNIENLQLASRGRVYLNAYQASVLLLVGLLAVPSASAFSGSAQTAQVPPEYQQLYSTLKSSLDDFNATLATMGPGTGSLIFGAELFTCELESGGCVARAGYDAGRDPVLGPA
jgi:hypothetical protein